MSKEENPFRSAFVRSISTKILGGEKLLRSSALKRLDLAGVHGGKIVIRRKGTERGDLIGSFLFSPGAIAVSTLVSFWDNQYMGGFAWRASAFDANPMMWISAPAGTARRGFGTFVSQVPGTWICDVYSRVERWRRYNVGRLELHGIIAGRQKCILGYLYTRFAIALRFSK